MKTFACFLACGWVAVLAVDSPAAAEVAPLSADAAVHESPDGKSMGQLLKNAEVEPLLVQGEWTRVQVMGWMPRGAFAKIPSLLARVRTLTVEAEQSLRAKPDGAPVGRLSKGARVEMADATKKWIKAGFAGWVKSSAIGKKSAPAPSNVEGAAPEPPKPAEAAGPGPRVRITTNQGVIVLELDPARAPKTVENFLLYVRKAHFDGTIFHRVIPTFMIQCGGYTADYVQKPTEPPIPIESNNGLANTRGTVAMARTNDPNSATSQFFINVVDNAFLNYRSPGEPGYAVFGRVVEGMDIADKIRNIPTGAGGPFRSDVPTTPVVIEKAEVIQ